MTKLRKLLGIVICVIVLNIMVFSPGFIGLEFDGTPFTTALGVTVLLCSMLVLVFSSYFLLYKQPAPLALQRMQSQEDYIEALSHYKRMKPLSNEIHLAIGQLERMRRRKHTLIGVLAQRFDPTELSYNRFAAVTQEVEKLFYLNVRSMLNRLHVFDEVEFERVMNHRSAILLHDKLLQEKKALYHEQLIFIENSLGANEEILLKLDKLLLEISRLDSFELKDINNLSCIQEIDSLIKQTQYYKQ